MKRLKNLKNEQEDLKYFINFYKFLSKYKNEEEIYFYIKNFVEEKKINQKKVHKYIYSIKYDNLLNIMKKIDFHIESQKEWNYNNAENYFYYFIKKIWEF